MKRNNLRYSRFSLVGFLLFFLTIGFTSTCAIFVYSATFSATNGNTFLVALAVIGILLTGAILCTFADIYRRKIMIERPVNLILKATKKIASGDFSVKLNTLHEYEKYDEYDHIFENINIMTAELSKNQVLKSDFISNISHEINTPLAIIQNYAKTLKNTNLTPEKQQEIFDVLEQQSKKLSQLITNILKLNKLENQKIIPENEQFDLAELLRIITLQYEEIIEKKHLKLECDIDEVSIYSSPTLIEIVLNNLISNAVKFTDTGTISVTLKQNKTHAIIKVQDTGCGISNETGTRIFDKFYQGDTSHSIEGNGLGLALVKQVIDLIGGEISVESKINQGSTFTLKVKKG